MMSSAVRLASAVRLVGLALGISLAPQALAQTDGHPRARPERHVVLMPVVGVWQHAFKDSRYESKVGPVWGMDVVIDPFRWMNVRGSVLRGNQPLAVPSQALSKDFVVSQPTLEVLRLDMRLEPIYHYSERLGFYAGLGLGWARMTAPEPTTAAGLVSYDRNSVYVGYEGALGVQFEPLLDWMMVDFSVASSYLANQSGNAYQKAQAFTADGHRTDLSALSKFGMGYRMSLGVGIIL